MKSISTKLLLTLSVLLGTNGVLATANTFSKYAGVYEGEFVDSDDVGQTRRWNQCMDIDQSGEKIRFITVFSKEHWVDEVWKVTHAERGIYSIAKSADVHKGATVTKIAQAGFGTCWENDCRTMFPSNDVQNRANMDDFLFVKDGVRSWGMSGPKDRHPGKLLSFTSEQRVRSQKASCELP